MFIYVEGFCDFVFNYSPSENRTLLWFVIDLIENFGRATHKQDVFLRAIVRSENFSAQNFSNALNRTTWETCNISSNSTPYDSRNENFCVWKQNDYSVKWHKQLDIYFETLRCTYCGSFSISEEEEATFISLRQRAGRSRNDSNISYVLCLSLECSWTGVGSHEKLEKFTRLWGEFRL